MLPEGVESAGERRRQLERLEHPPVADRFR
jgi:hypothetical protein